MGSDVVRLGRVTSRCIIKQMSPTTETTKLRLVVVWIPSTNNIQTISNEQAGSKYRG